jgi:hypothetical protein
MKILRAGPWGVGWAVRGWWGAWHGAKRRGKGEAAGLLGRGPRARQGAAGTRARAHPGTGRLVRRAPLARVEAQRLGAAKGLDGAAAALDLCGARGGRERQAPRERGGGRPRGAGRGCKQGRADPLHPKPPMRDHAPTWNVRPPPFVRSTHVAAWPAGPMSGGGGGELRQQGFIHVVGRETQQPHTAPSVRPSPPAVLRCPRGGVQRRAHLARCA